MDKINEIDIKKLFQEKLIKIKDKNLIIDIEELIEHDFNIYDFLIENPETFIKYLKNESELYNLKNPLIYFKKWKDNIDISKIRVRDIGKIVKLDGMINKITDPLALITSKKFECKTCGSVINISQDINKLNNIKQPTKCSCGGSKFLVIEETLQDIQELILEELQERTEGKQPQKIRVRISDKLTTKEKTEILKPGTRVSIIGLIDKIPLKAKQEEEIFQYRVKAIQVTGLEDKFDDTLNEGDLEDIEGISFDNPVEKLKDSLAPEIWGRDDLKTILLLQMVGGVQKQMLDGKMTRYWTNILVVGSPSTSKSELAKNVNLRCPKSFYASGDNSSGVGITATVVRDELLGSWGCEVGPIVKASGSLAVIDELDKFPKDQLKALHTPLESGFVHVTKAGIDSKFAAETALLAIANPKDGVFDDNKSIVEQISLPPALLSRFDIIYTLKDNVEKDNDDRIAEIIYSQNTSQNDKLIPVQLFRKYITYARTFKPTLPVEHLKALQEFYHDVRKKSISRDSNMKGIPIGTRHLQGIIRLAEASAKLNLRKVVHKDDFELAKKLFYDSLIKIGLDEGGVFDMSRISGGKSISKRKMMDLLMDNIRIICAKNDKVKDSELRILMKEKGMNSENYYKSIDELNRECSILKSGDSWKVA